MPRSFLKDYKAWIQERADEIALEEQGKDFYELPNDMQDMVYNKATEDYKDAYADMMDATYEAIRDRRISNPD